jgi:hypothetical protein
MCRFTIEMACWRSWLERGTTGAKVAGSRPAWGIFFVFNNRISSYILRPGHLDDLTGNNKDNLNL